MLQFNKLKIFTKFTIRACSQGPEESARAAIVQVKERDSRGGPGTPSFHNPAQRGQSQQCLSRKQIYLQKSVHAQGQHLVAIKF